MEVKMSMWWHKKAEELLKGKKILDVKWQEWDPDDRDCGSGLIFETEDNVTDDEAFNLAIEHLDYNVIGGSLGEFTPVVMYKDG